MPELLLRRTPEEIQEHNRRFSASLRILRLLNLLPPRSWRFTFTFVREKTILSLQSEPRLTADDFRLLADGTVPEVFHADEVRFSDSRHWAVRCSVSPGERSNALTFFPWDAQKFEGIQLVGFYGGVLPPVFQSAADVKQQLYELTWFGSDFKANVYGARSFTWDVFGAVQTHRPQRRRQRVEASDLVETFEVQVSDEQGNHIGAAALILSSSRGITSNKLYHSRLGLVSTPGSLSEWLPREYSSRTGFVVELDENRLAYGADGEIGPYDTLKTVLAALGNAMRTHSQSPQFLRLLSRVERADRERAARALAGRQEALRERPRVYYGEVELGCVPESENEVVVLLAKLETAGGIPVPLFRLLEYTPRQGIDALGDFQLSTEAAPERLAPIEVEYHFESFLRHGHAVEQVRLIICWSFRSESTRSSLALERQKEWLYTYSRGQYSVSVFLLSQLPGLTERGGRK